MRRKKGNYFKTSGDAPQPVTVSMKRRALFSEVDIMGIVWHGRYPQYFEEGSALLGRHCGMSYKDYYEAGLRAPIVQLHIDYHSPIKLDDVFTISASMVWSEGARINTEYTLTSANGNTAVTGYTVQMFVPAGGGEVCIVSPGLMEKCRKRWKNGDLYA